jgi:hypothetical protein
MKGEDWGKVKNKLVPKMKSVAMVLLGIMQTLPFCFLFLVQK